MYDPLGTPTGFGDDTPPWPTTPHPPNSPVPNLRPAPTSDRISDGNPFEKQPQIYGQPEPGLISPPANPASNGDSFEKPDPYLKVRSTSLDRNRRDILVRFDAQVRWQPFLVPHLGAYLVLRYLKKKYRQTYQISPEEHTETYRGHMSSFSNSTMPSHTTIRKPLSPPSHSHKHPPLLTKKMIDW